jgi:hypothetical protein
MFNKTYKFEAEVDEMFNIYICLLLLTDSDVVLNWIIDSKLLVFAYQAINDGESYVRASSLHTLQAVLFSTKGLIKHLLLDMSITMVSCLFLTSEKKIPWDLLLIVRVILFVNNFRYLYSYLCNFRMRL